MCGMFQPQPRGRKESLARYLWSMGEHVFAMPSSNFQLVDTEFEQFRGFQNVSILGFGSLQYIH